MPQIISKTPSVTSCLLIKILILIIGFLGGLYLGETGKLSLFTGPSVSLIGQSGTQKTVVKNGSYEEGYQVALDFARNKLQNRGCSPILGPDGLHFLYNAKVKSISGSDIVVEFDASQLDIFQEGLITKTVKVPDPFFINQRIPKPSDELKKEYDEYQKKMAEIQKNPEIAKTQMPLTPPMPFTIKELNVKDLKEGDILDIQTKDDIAKTDTFEPSSIVLINILKIENPSAPPIANTAPAEPVGTAPSVENTLPQ